MSAKRAAESGAAGRPGGRTRSLTDRPLIYCPGCGHGLVHRLVAEVIDELELRERTIGIAPVGCAVTAYDYWDFDVSESAHGRAPAVATGIKRVLPDRVVFTYQGDGDLAAIGTAEIIHAANRGERFTTVFVNNAIYGMTGGQLAPTTLPGMKTATTPAGRDPARGEGHPLKVCELLSSLAGAVYLARGAVDTPAAVRRLKGYLRRAFQVQLEGRGFSLVEVLTACPVNLRLKPVEAYAWIAERMYPVFPPGVIKDTAGK